MGEHDPTWRHRWRDIVLSEFGPEGAGARLTALAVARCVDNDTLETFIGAQKLARLTDLNEKTIRGHLLSLTAAGWLTARAKQSGHGWRLRLLRLAIPAERADVFTAAPAGLTEVSSARTSKQPDVSSRLPEENAPTSGKNLRLSRSDITLSDLSTSATTRLDRRQTRKLEDDREALQRVQAKAAACGYRAQRPGESFERYSAAVAVAYVEAKAAQRGAA